MGQGEKHQRRTREVSSDKGEKLRGRAWNGHARHHSVFLCAPDALTAHGSVFSHDYHMTQRESGQERETWREGAPQCGDPQRL